MNAAMLESARLEGENHSPSNSRKVADRRSSRENPFVARLESEQRGETLLLQVCELIGNDAAETVCQRMPVTP